MKTARTVLVAAALWAMSFASCQMMHVNPWGHRSAKPAMVPGPYQFKAKHEKPSRLGSWFGEKEPDPPKTVKDWMNLEPIRP